MWKYCLLIVGFTGLILNTAPSQNPWERDQGEGNAPAFTSPFTLLTSVRQQTEQSADYKVAWTTTSGELWLETSENLIQIAEQGACCAVFSPSGSRLTYVLSGENGQQLVILDTANPNEVVSIIPPSDDPPNAIPAFISWQNDDLLWMNILHRTEINLLESDWELWQVDTNTGEITLAEGLGGVAYPSPDGRFVAVVFPGVYEETPASISLVDAENGVQLNHHEFPAVSSGSHLPWLPDVSWVSDGVRLAIPDPDILYRFDSATPFSRLVALGIDGTQTDLGEVEVIYPAKTIWSPDGTSAAYISPAEAASQNLVVRTGNEEQIIRERVPFGTEVLFWHDTLVFSVPEEGVFLWMSQDGIVNQIENVWGVTTSDSDLVLLIGSPTGKIILWNDGEETLISEDISAFDVILAHGLR